MIANRLRKDAPAADSPGSRTIAFRTSDGALVDGAGQVFTPTLTGTAAPTGATKAPTGTLFINTTGTAAYVNMGTFASPAWELITSA
jgi:hypothetical protein